MHDEILRDCGLIHRHQDRHRFGERHILNKRKELINRASPRTGYWDDPVRQVTPDEATMQFVRFFDGDEVGQRDFKFIEARITSFPTQHQLVVGTP